MIDSASRKISTITESDHAGFPGLTDDIVILVPISIICVVQVLEQAQAVVLDDQTFLGRFLGPGLLAAKAGKGRGSHHRE